MPDPVTWTPTPDLDPHTSGADLGPIELEVRQGSRGRWYWTCWLELPGATVEADSAAGLATEAAARQAAEGTARRLLWLVEGSGSGMTTEEARALPAGAEPGYHPCPPCPDCGAHRRWRVLPGGGINARCLRCGREGCFDNLTADDIRIPEEFGQFLRQARRAAGYSQRELAGYCQAAGARCSHTYLSKLEGGRLPPPSEELVMVLALILGVDQDTEDRWQAFCNRAPQPVAALFVESAGARRFFRAAFDATHLTEADWDALEAEVWRRNDGREEVRNVTAD